MDAMQCMDSIAPAPAAAHARGAFECLTFTIGLEEYGIDILKVQELRGYEAPVQLANAPEFIKGVVNLRGVIVPIIDMRIKLNHGSPVYDPFTVVIIMNLTGRTVGMVVDGVSDVITLAAEQVRPAPGMGSATDVDYMMGIGALGERMLILVDIDKLMASASMARDVHALSKATPRIQRH